MKVRILPLLAAGLAVPPLLAQQPPPAALVQPRTLVPVPGTRVSIAPPPGFAPSDRFSGFHRPDAGASILVNEYAVPVETVRGGMTEQALARQGMELLSRSQAVAGGVVGTLFSVREQVRGRPYRKWMALFGDDAATVLISASFPEALAEQLALPLRDSLLSSGWNPRARVAAQAGLRFRVREIDGLGVLRRVGSLLVMGDPARGVAPSPLDPLLVAGEAVADRDPDDLEDFARHRLRQFDRVLDLRDVEGGPVGVDGREGWELAATGDDVYGSGPMRVYQLVVPEGRRYVLVQALVGADEADDYLPRFREVARGMSFRD